MYRINPTRPVRRVSVERSEKKYHAIENTAHISPLPRPIQPRLFRFDTSAPLRFTYQYYNFFFFFTTFVSDRTSADEYVFMMVDLCSVLHVVKTSLSAVLGFICINSFR